jgi:hypothetical protein
METLIRWRAGFLRFVVPGLVALVLISSCKTAQPEAQVRVEEVFPLVPFTREIMERIRQQGQYQLGDLQYYISTGVILERLSGNERFLIYPHGDGLIWRRDEVVGMRIDYGTQGVLVEASPEAGTTLTVYFDERYRNSPMSFEESPVDYRYYLQYDESAGTLEMNGAAYSFRFIGDTPPYLLIRIKEDLTQPVRSVTLRGVAVRKVGIKEGASFLPLKVGRSQDLPVPIRNYLRSPVIIRDARLSTDNPFITIASPTQTVGEMPVGGELTLNYRISVASNCPQGAVTFSMVFTDEIDTRREERFIVPVENVSSGR